MNFTMSACVAVQAEDPDHARKFYTEVLGFPAEDQGDVLAIDAAPLTLYVDEKRFCDGMLMELLVEDLEASLTLLQDNGCVLVHRGGGNSCVIRDPFGVHFNLWQQDAS